jgi:stress response protein YsnF
MTLSMPLVAEHVDIDVKTGETNRVQFATRVVETEEVVALALRCENVQIQRVSINRPVERALPIRHEGDVTIVPVYEEVLVVTRQLVLKEELHISKRSSTLPAQPETFTLSHEEVTITGSPADNPH